MMSPTVTQRTGAGRLSACPDASAKPARKPATIPAVTERKEPASCLLFQAPERKSRNDRILSPMTQTATVAPNGISAAGCDRTRVTGHIVDGLNAARSTGLGFFPKATRAPG